MTPAESPLTPRVSDYDLAEALKHEGADKWADTPSMDIMLAALLDLRDTRAALAASREQVRVLREALESCEDYFDQRADADAQGDPMRYVGNKEMTMLGEVRAALAAAVPDERGKP